MNFTSVSGKNWKFKKFNITDIKKYSETYSLAEITAKLLAIRKIKKDLQYIIDKSSDNKQLISLINEFSNKLSVIENKIHMTKNQSRQDPLNYGIRINNRLAFLMADSQRGDFPPTDQSIEFFNVIKE